ncbi:hypothetical protein IFM89_001628 [Coptis chinensis]|uniref:pectinesterase n=1 Tax=Coptis chinensis TaxID=261450 RepID=A0A835HJX8_9MAGN|nr:hypothetical protein IFM89_001628 [Coptis chinensis]
MSSLLLLSLLSLYLFFFFSFTSAAQNNHRKHPIDNNGTNPSQIAQQACKATRNIEACVTTITQSPTLPPNPKPLDVINSAIWAASKNLKNAESMAKEILDTSQGNPNKTNAAKNCLDFLHYSQARLNSTVETLPSGRIKDGRAWTSAALLYQYDCWSALKYVNDSQRVNETMAFMNSTIGLTSNALSMLFSYDNFGENFDAWKPPMTERSGFWENVGGSSVDIGFFSGGLPSNLTVDVTVCKEEGKGCVKSIQEAVNNAPDNDKVKKFVIKINQGVYQETVRVPFEKKNVVFLGDGVGKTVITGSLNVGVPGVVGDGFMARDITFENSAGPVAHQAVAFRSDSDLSIIENCEFLGNQDTLYAHSLRQYYKSCHIEGNVDFIFGNSAAVFQDSVILVRPRQLNPEKGEQNAVTAHGRTDPAQSTGFVFQNCLINGTEDYMALYHSKQKVHRTFLGRPWKDFSRTVFIQCNLEALINSDGWLPWSGNASLSTLYYGEFKNSGPGVNVTSRVPWSNQIPKEHAIVYSVQNFIQGSDWIPTSA